MTTLTERKPLTLPITPIAAMHDRIETAWSAFAKLEAAENALDDSDPSCGTIKQEYRADREKIDSEADTLGVDILYQVPLCWSDALILQFHIWAMADPLRSRALRKDECEALLVGMETLFDFMAAEFPCADHAAIGPLLKGFTMRAWNRRRDNTITAATQENM